MIVFEHELIFKQPTLSPQPANVVFDHHILVLAGFILILH